ncbi:MAG: class II aldolase/adducin family protein [Microthrixaceae bacterium]|nr:class II aldolase/adducin family protein [Microthrixaceae bacterium]
MSESIDEVRVAVLDTAKQIHARGLVAGTAGNVSGRVGGTRSGDTVIGRLRIDDRRRPGRGRPRRRGPRGRPVPTSENALHLECYRKMPEVRGVVHCHAKYSSMFAVAHRPIPAGIDEFVIYIGGDVPCAPYRQSGTDELATELAALLRDRSAALMANHGMVCVGGSVQDALHTTLVVEHNAQIMWGAEALGGVQPLPEQPVADFRGVYEFVRSQMWGT